MWSSTQLEEWSALDDEVGKAVLEMIEKPAWPFDEPQPVPMDEPTNA